VDLYLHSHVRLQCMVFNYAQDTSSWRGTGTTLPYYKSLCGSTQISEDLVSITIQFPVYNNGSCFRRNFVNKLKFSDFSSRTIPDSVQGPSTAQEREVFQGTGHTTQTWRVLTTCISQSKGRTQRIRRTAPKGRKSIGSWWRVV